MGGSDKSELLVVGSVAYDCIETPEASEDFVLGGSASFAALAASYFSPVRLSGIIGCDFKESDIGRLAARGINIDDLEIDSAKPTFFWRGKYHDNFNTRETLEVRLNAFEGWTPKLSERARQCKFVLLGNIAPSVQAAALDAVKSPKFVVLDTMDLWINTANSELKELVKRADLLILNDSEAKMLSGQRNVVKAGDALLELGAKSAIIKAGEYGAMLFHKDGFFVTPAYPVRSLHDPTGAGDSFAGALAGFVAGTGDSGFESIKNAMVAAAATASMTVESFSCRKLEESGMVEICRRRDFIKKISKI